MILLSAHKSKLPEVNKICDKICFFDKSCAKFILVFAFKKKYRARNDRTFWLLLSTISKSTGVTGRITSFFDIFDK